MPSLDTFWCASQAIEGAQFSQKTEKATHSFWSFQFRVSCLCYPICMSYRKSNIKPYSECSNNATLMIQKLLRWLRRHPMAKWCRGDMQCKHANNKTGNDSSHIHKSCPPHITMHSRSGLFLSLFLPFSRIVPASLLLLLRRSFFSFLLLLPERPDSFFSLTGEWPC
jgi:hypothetical protein